MSDAEPLGQPRFGVLERPMRVRAGCELDVKRCQASARRQRPNMNVVDIDHACRGGGEITPQLVHINMIRRAFEQDME